MKSLRHFFSILIVSVYSSILCDVAFLEIAYGQDQKSTSDDVIVLVDGQPITSGDIEFMMLSRKVPSELKGEMSKRFSELLIEQRLMQSFLSSRKIEANQIALDQQVDRILSLIKQNGKEADKVLANFGYSEETLRRELSLPLAWKSYVRTLVSQENLREYWELHREEFDGTEVRAAHIFLKISDTSDANAVAEASQQLEELNSKIQAGKISFSDAAKEHSQAPSSKSGGDLGFFPYRGRMAVAFSQAAFPLKKGEVSKPFQTPFGVHLITVTDRRPGQLSLEDVRGLVFKQRSTELWDEIVAQQRAKAKIEWKSETE